ncbi:hypothetical protein JCM21900_005302 [Sporobolomyces salmonicolor]
MAATIRSSNSWLGTLAQPPSAAVLNGKFSTVAAVGSEGARRPRGGFGVFGDGAGDPNGRGEQEDVEEELRDLQGLGKEDEAGWSVTVAEGPKARSRSRKPDPFLTIYVSTPTSSLTLSRKLSEVVDLEERLRAQFPSRLPSRQTSTAPPATPKKRNNVLASLTRTLSPRRSSQNSFTSFSSAGKESRSSSFPVDFKDLGSILTKASFDHDVRSTSTWKVFFNVRKDDLESARVERRIKRARSDQTMHLAPTGLNPTGTSIVPLAAGNRASTHRSSRQDASGGTGTNHRAATASSVDLSEAQSVSFFDLPDIPSSKFVMEAEQKMSVDVGVDPEVLHDSERREASAAAQATTSSEAAALEPPDVYQDLLATAPPEDSATPIDAEGARSSRHLHPRPRPSSTSASAATDTDMTPSHSDVGSAISVDREPKDVTVDSFDILRVLGKGCAGKVLLVRLKGSESLYALKAITKRHVLAHRELQHTKTEQSVLKTCARDKSNPFVVRMHYSFHDHDTLYLTLDFHPGGDLATQLARWGRLGRDRARFYMAEICEGVEGLHRAGIIYRDLKPENVLISTDGHVVLTDFGLSKDFGHARVAPPTATLADDLPRPHWLSSHPTRSASTPPASSAWLMGRRETTQSFCGTAEYLAPEVLLGEPYSYEVDAWSAGTMLYEMLAGITPFYAEDHATMYRRVLHDELTFDDIPEDRVFDEDTKSLLRGMLQRDPLLRMSDARIKRHPYFSMIEWAHVYHKRYVPPFVPVLNPLDPSDTSQFDDVFLSMAPQVKGDEDEEGGGRDPPEGEPQPAFDETGRDVFDGYSYYGRDSASIHRREREGDEVDGGGAAGEEKEDDVLLETVKPAGPAEPGRVVASERDEDITNRFLTSTPPPEPTAPIAQPDEADGADESGITSHLTVSSIASGSTQATTLPVGSPAASRHRQLSSRSNLEPVFEHPAQAMSTEILVEEPEEHSDSEWDLVSADDAGGFARNGGRGATLWARGFKDRYRLVLAPLSSPLRPPPILRSNSRGNLRGNSRGNSRKGSSSSGQSSLHGISTSTTPEPPVRPANAMRRLTSVRSSSVNKDKGKNGLRSRKSQGSLEAAGIAPSSSSRTLPPPPSPRKIKKLSASPLTPAVPGVGDSTPRTAGQAIKKLAKSAFLPKN